MVLKCFVNDSEMLFNSFEKLSNDLEMFCYDWFNDLSSSSKRIERATYKGGGALNPFVGMLSHKLFRLVLKSFKRH